jgi:hypothetical protein
MSDGAIGRIADERTTLPVISPKAGIQTDDFMAIVQPE